MNPTSPLAEQPAQATPRLIVIFPALMLALGIGALDQQIVNTALPRIVAELGGLSHLSWVVTAFLLAQTCTMPLYGKLSDLYGRKSMFMIAISIFLVGSALCGLAQTMTQLIVFRAVQGLGAGGLYTLVSTTVGDFVAPRERGRYQGYFTGVFVMCTVAGPVVGGLLTSAFTWRSVFLINLPLGAVVFVVLGLALPRSPRVKHSIDYLGAILIAVATIPLLLALSWGGLVRAWTSPVMLALGSLAILAYTVLILHERRAAEPILGVHLLNRPVFRWGVFTCGLVGFAFYGSNVFLPLYFQIVLGLAPAVAGIMILPQVLGNLTASIVGGHWISRSGRYRTPLILGVGLLTMAFGGLSWLCAQPTPLWAFEACLFVLGLGGNLCFLSLTVSVQNSVERQSLGLATSSFTFFNSLLGAAGVALFGTILATQLKAYLVSHGAPPVSAGALTLSLKTMQIVPKVVAGAYRQAIAAAFFVSMILNVFTLGAALKVPQIEMQRRTPADSPESAPAHQ